MKSIKRLLVKVMAASLLVSSVLSFPATKAQAAVKNYYLNVYQDEAIMAVSSGDTIKDGKYGTDSKFTFTGGLKKYYSSASAVEIAAGNDQSISFKVDKYATVIVRASSTSEDNDSVVALVNDNDMPLASENTKEELVKLSGSTMTTIVYTNLVSGTYYVKNKGESSGVRVQTIIVLQNDTLDSVAENYYMDPGSDAKLSKLDPNVKVEVGKYGSSNFFNFADDADFKDSYINKRANQAEYAVEMAKKNGSSIGVTVKEGASLVVLVSSTSGTNLSDICLADASDADNTTNKIKSSNMNSGIVTVQSKEITVITYNNLHAGSYKISCPIDGDNTGRGVRVYLMFVQQPGTASATPTAIPTPSPSPTPSPTPTPTSTPTPTQEAAVTPEPTQAVETPTPTVAEEVTPLPTATSAPDPTKAPEATATSIPVPTEEPVTEPTSSVSIKDMLPVIGLVVGIIVVGVAIVVAVIILDKKTRNSNKKQYK